MAQQGSSHWSAKHDPQRVVPASLGLALPPTVAATAVTTADAVPTATTAAASTITADAASTPVSGPPTRLHFVSPQLTTGLGKVTTLSSVFTNMWTPEFRDAIHKACVATCIPIASLFPTNCSSNVMQPSTMVSLSLLTPAWLLGGPTCTLHRRSPVVFRPPA
jgi:hypothetical protein